MGKWNQLTRLNTAYEKAANLNAQLRSVYREIPGVVFKLTIWKDKALGNGVVAKLRTGGHGTSTARIEAQRRQIGKKIPRTEKQLARFKKLLGENNPIHQPDVKQRMGKAVSKALVASEKFQKKNEALRIKTALRFLNSQLLIGAKSALLQIVNERREQKQWFEAMMHQSVCPSCGISFFTSEFKEQKGFEATNSRGVLRLRLGAFPKRCEGCRIIGRKAVAYESVSKKKVFERDDWKCQHCGAETPQELVGKNFPNAPTLDHILPIAYHGAHSYFNTQCLCHRCNSVKSANIDKEPKLIGVVDFEPYRAAKNPSRLTWKQEERYCDCGCEEKYIPGVSGNAFFKHGHWNKTSEAIERQKALEQERREKLLKEFGGNVSLLNQYLYNEASSYLVSKGN